MKNGKLSLSGYITRLAILLALVVVLQTFGSYIKIGTVSISLVLIPVVFGGMILGVLAGTVLGFAFGIVTLIAGITGADGFTQILFTAHPFGTTIICIVKATAAGLVPALVFNAIKNKNQTVAAFTAAALAPIINTGLFIVGVLLFVRDTVAEHFLQGESIMYFLIIGCAGVNFIVEFVLNLLLAPALNRVYRVVGGKFSSDVAHEADIEEINKGAEKPSETAKDEARKSDKETKGEE